MWYVFFSIFSFRFYSFYLQLTYEPPPWPNCAMMTTTHTGHKTQKVEMGTRRWGPNDETGFRRLCPWYIFFFSFFLILFTIRTRDASCVLGLYFFITTSNNGLEMRQNASWDSLSPYLPWQARGARDVSRALFYFFFSFLLSRQVASTADRPNKDGPCCLGQWRQQAKPEATAHQWDQTISSWGLTGGEVKDHHPGEANSHHP